MVAVAGVDGTAGSHAHEAAARRAIISRDFERRSPRDYYWPDFRRPVTHTARNMVDRRRAQWPPFTDEHLFGLWFWEYYRSGDLVSVDSLIAEAPGTVFWIDTSAILGSDSCAAAHGIKSPEGFKLERGRYVYHQALRAGEPVPSLRVLLADTGKTDLAPRFRRAADYDGWEDPGSGSPRTVRHNVAGHVRS